MPSPRTVLPSGTNPPGDRPTLMDEGRPMSIGRRNRRVAPGSALLAMSALVGCQAVVPLPTSPSKATAPAASGPLSGTVPAPPVPDPNPTPPAPLPPIPPPQAAPAPEPPTPLLDSALIRAEGARRVALDVGEVRQESGDGCPVTGDRGRGMGDGVIAPAAPEPAPTPAPAPEDHPRAPAVVPEPEPVKPQPPAAPEVEPAPSEAPQPPPAEAPQSPPAEPPREEPDPEIAHLQLCRKVVDFGRVEPLDPASLRAGQTVLLYCEMTGVRYEPRGDAFRSRVAASVQLLAGPGDTPTWTKDLGPADDTCRRPRRDYYISIRLTLPPGLKPGPYRLRLTQTDALAGRSAHAELPIAIRP